jgi:hypothetical protein
LPPICGLIIGFHQFHPFVADEPVRTVAILDLLYPLVPGEYDPVQFIGWDSSRLQLLDEERWFRVSFIVFLFRRMSARFNSLAVNLPRAGTVPCLVGPPAVASYSWARFVFFWPCVQGASSIRRLMPGCASPLLLVRSWYGWWKLDTH